MITLRDDAGWKWAKIGTQLNIDRRKGQKVSVKMPTKNLSKDGIQRIVENFTNKKRKNLSAVKRKLNCIQLLVIWPCTHL